MSGDILFFVQSLSNENCLVVPPVCLVSNMLHYMFEQKAVGSLIVPFWPFFLVTVRWKTVETRTLCWALNVIKVQ